MFADSLLETSWAQRTRRSWTTLTSFGVQAAIIGLLLLIPLLTTVGLPIAHTTVSTPISMGRHDPSPLSHPHGARSGVTQINTYISHLVAPGRMPIGIHNDSRAEEEPAGPPCDAGCVPGARDGVGEGFNLPFTGTHPVMPSTPPAPTRPTFRTSTILQGMLIRRVEPVYPTPAKLARVQGPVVLEAIISKDGTIEHLQLVSGHPMLVPAAIGAVSQWRYRPYILNGDAIEVETRITVNFILSN